MSKRTMIKLTDGSASGYSVRQQLERKGIDLHDGKCLKVSFVIKYGCRRKIKSGTLSLVKPCSDGCCSECLSACHSGKAFTIH